MAKHTCRIRTIQKARLPQIVQSDLEAQTRHPENRGLQEESSTFTVSTDSDSTKVLHQETRLRRYAVEVLESARSMRLHGIGVLSRGEHIMLQYLDASTAVCTVFAPLRT